MSHIGKFTKMLSYLSLQKKNIKQIETVRSHAQAIGQCKKNIYKLKLQPIVAADTAGSAKYISEHQIETESAIASALLGPIFGLLQTICTETFPISYPALVILPKASFNNISPLAP